MARAASLKSWRKTSIWRPASRGPEGRLLLKGWWHLANALYAHPFLKSNRLCCWSVYQYLSGWGMYTPCKLWRIRFFTYGIDRSQGACSQWTTAASNGPLGILSLSLSGRFEHWKGKGWNWHVHNFTYIYTVRKNCRTRVSKCKIAHRAWLQKMFVLNICELFWNVESWAHSQYIEGIWGNNMSTTMASFRLRGYARCFFSLFCRCEVHWMNQKGFTQKAMVKMIAGTMRGFFSGFFGHSGATWCHHLAFHKWSFNTLRIPSPLIRTQLHQYHMASLGPLGEVGEGVGHNANKWPKNHTDEIHWA